MLQPWFSDAKFGIFIHWGIYSLGNTSESWPFFSGDVAYDDYMAQAKEFTAEHYDPEEWARLFAAAGAKYAVLTTKHHDGFALWFTKENSLNAVESSPAGRDLIGPYCDALRKYGLKVGLYYSHLDWSHPDYASVLPKAEQPHDHAQNHSNRFGYPQDGEDPQEPGNVSSSSIALNLRKFALYINRICSGSTVTGSVTQSSGALAS